MTFIETFGCTVDLGLGLGFGNTALALHIYDLDRGLDFDIADIPGSMLILLRFSYDELHPAKADDYGPNLILTVA